MNGTKKMLRTT
jgi:hypothetical protein